MYQNSGYVNPLGPSFPFPPAMNAPSSATPVVVQVARPGESMMQPYVDQNKVAFQNIYGTSTPSQAVYNVTDPSQAVYNVTDPSQAVYNVTDVDPKKVQFIEVQRPVSVISEPEVVVVKRRERSAERPKSKKTEVTRRSRSASPGPQKSIIRRNSQVVDQKNRRNSGRVSSRTQKATRSQEKLVEKADDGDKCCGAPAKTCATIFTILFVIALAVAIIFLVLFLINLLLGCSRCDVSKLKERLTVLPPSINNPFPSAYYTTTTVNNLAVSYYLMEGDGTAMTNKSPSNYAALVWHCGTNIRVFESQLNIGNTQTEILLGNVLNDNNRRFMYFMRPGFRYTVQLENPSTAVIPKNALVSIHAVSQGVVIFNQA